MGTFERKVWESPTYNFHTQEQIDKIKQSGSNVESNVRALKAVGIQQEHFGSLLIPIILEKVPTSYDCR